LACIAAIALLAAGAVVYATRDAVSAGADSSVYVATANSVAAGEGLKVPFHFYPLGNLSIGTPPLYGLTEEQVRERSQPL